MHLRKLYTTKNSGLLSSMNVHSYSVRLYEMKLERDLFSIESIDFITLLTKLFSRFVWIEQSFLE